jgi:hypothetical protein
MSRASNCKTSTHPEKTLDAQVSDKRFHKTYKIAKRVSVFCGRRIWVLLIMTTKHKSAVIAYRANRLGNRSADVPRRPGYVNGKSKSKLPYIQAAYFVCDGVIVF